MNKMNSSIMLAAGLLAVGAQASLIVTYGFDDFTAAASVGGSGTDGSLAAVDMYAVQANGTTTGGLEGTASWTRIVNLTTAGTTDHVAGTSDMAAFRMDQGGSTFPGLDTDAGFRFTLTPDTGKTLDFSSATFDGIFGTWSDRPETVTNNWGLFCSIDGGALTQVGGTGTHIVAPGTGFDSVRADNNSRDFYSGADNGAYTLGAISTIDLSGITGLTEDQAVEFRIVATPNLRYAQNQFLVDDVTVSGIDVIPEPAVLSLVVVFGGALLATRRISMP
ncbi:MAG: hypothetical protein ABFR47_02420 [Verrucomicrobiota bacterium]